MPYRPGTVQPEARWVRAVPARHGPTFSSRPYRYNDSLVPAGIEYETFNVHPGTKIDQTPRVSTVLSTTSSALIRKADGMASGGALEEQVASLLCRASIVFLLGQES